LGKKSLGEVAGLARSFNDFPVGPTFDGKLSESSD
jgi:hypothetical protein